MPPHFPPLRMAGIWPFIPAGNSRASVKAAALFCCGSRPLQGVRWRENTGLAVRRCARAAFGGGGTGPREAQRRRPGGEKGSRQQGFLRRAAAVHFVEIKGVLDLADAELDAQLKEPGDFRDTVVAPKMMYFRVMLRGSAAAPAYLARLRVTAARPSPPLPSGTFPRCRNPG